MKAKSAAERMREWLLFQRECGFTYRVSSAILNQAVTDEMKAEKERKPVVLLFL